MRFEFLIKIKAKLLNEFKYLKVFLKIFLFKFKALFNRFVEITLTLDAFVLLNFPFIITKCSEPSSLFLKILVQKFQIYQWKFFFLKLILLISHFLTYVK